MSNPFRYQLGDLVDFKASRVTEEYIDETMLTGLIIEQRYVFTADNKCQPLNGTPEFCDYVCNMEQVS